MESFGLSVKDLEADFDPDTYDDVMGKVFNEDYYKGAEEEEGKPEFSDFELEEEMQGKQIDCVLSSGSPLSEVLSFV